MELFLRAMFLFLLLALATAATTDGRFASSDLGTTLGIAIAVPLGSAWYAAQSIA